jgi:hypothetical protein
VRYPEVLEVGSLIATASLIPIRARRLAPTAPTVTAPTVTAPTAPTVRARPVWWLRGYPSICAGIWPVRRRVAMSNVITPRSSADVKRSPLVVVLDSPFVAGDYAQQTSHGSPTSASVWIGADVTRLWPSRLRVCWRACGCHHPPEIDLGHTGEKNGATCRVPRVPSLKFVSLPHFRCCWL